ncbi:MAG: N-acetylglucosaminidase, partial [Firmicutes bacterium]|nr:N-acetylglucosaminidase [Bacillota bacterium]
NLLGWFINAANFVDEMLPALKVKENALNMRAEATTSKDNVILTLQPGAGPFFIISEAEDSKGDTWYRILTNTRVGWVHGDYVALTEKKGEGIFQFLLLSGTTNVNPVEVNEKILKGKGILAGHADAFIEGAEKYDINEIFLISLALHESGNGTSTLAKGVMYNGKKVYNMYGIGAVDGNELAAGSKYAYDRGWFTPELAIIGGAKFTSEGYISNNQDTLYKMRWNPGNPGTHQYATDIGWAAKQVSGIKKLYDQMTSFVLRL